MTVRAVFRCMVIWGMSPTVFGNAKFQVSQSPQHKIVTIGENITFTCAFTPLSDNSEVNVFWWKLGQSIFLQPTADRRRQYFIRKGQGTLQLLDIRLQDAGVYYCGVKQQRNTVTNGTGSSVVVHVPPSTPRILTKTPDGNSNIYLHLVCETTEFYPETITFSWYKNTSNVVTGIKTTKQLDNMGLYQASSILQESQPIQIDTFYICLVSHSTLPTPKLAVYLVSTSNPDINIKFEYLLTVGCVVSGFLCLVLGTIIGKGCQLRTRGDTKQNGSHHCEDTSMERRDDNTLDYAALNVNGLEKRGIRKENKKCTEYAAIKLDRKSNDQTVP
ncbi:tapasin-related protein-like isoform X2 [Heterodontus francisci]|uniref:tapasin-related protein-like isoform X2 n=1 Tax=Heterodontus francisci TaxID=7792 RepID=UPI00355B3924